MAQSKKVLWTLGLVALSGVAVTATVQAKQPGASPWTKHENLPTVVGADGQDHTATCSGYPGTDPKFSFWEKRGTSKNLVVFFEGGGACWDAYSCSYPNQFYTSAIPSNADPANYEGIFKLDNAANPVKDWTFVYIPYCTGDVHVGSADKTYYPGLTLHHRGYDNFMVVLDWIRNHVDAPKNILVTGSSAGGYGATAHFPWLAEAYPNAHMYVIADASQGVSTTTWDTYGRVSWNPQLPQWIFGPPPTSAPGSEFLSRAAATYPHAKVSQFTTAVDSVQVSFYGAMLALGYGPGVSCLTSPVVDWNQQMLGTLGTYASESKNFRYYVANGTYHTIMRSPGFYTENSAGIIYSNWVTAMLQNRGGTGGSGGGDWKDAACPTCLMPLTCP
ncbi:MAG: pectinacetylesterase family protein [Steroidobacteraceae bacterium]|nr:pectinacetylesterase family protein [Steroidobacteraceae bacterium]